MKTSVFKISAEQGKTLLLVAALGLLSNSALAMIEGEDCGTPMLDKYYEKAKSPKCDANKGLKPNLRHKESSTEAGACEAVYKAAREAIEDIRKKRKAACQKANEERAKMVNCLNGTGAKSNKCQSENKQVAGSAGGYKKDEANAANGLSKWLDKKEKKAAQAKKDLQNAKAGAGGGSGSGAAAAGEILSGVSEAMKKQAEDEQQEAEDFAREVKQALKQEANNSTAQSKKLNELANKSGKEDGNMKSVPTDQAGGKGQGGEGQQQANNGGGAGGGAGGGMPSPPGGGQGGDSGQSSISEPTQTAAADESIAPKSEGLLGNNTTSTSQKDMKLDGTPKDLAENSAGGADGAMSGTSASRMDTSLRDSLKAKLLGDAAEAGSGDALGGMPFGGGNSTSGKKGEGALAGGAGYSPLTGGFEDSSGGGGSGGGGDFSMARSETDAAVNNLLNEFGQAGTDPNRDLAETQGADPSIQENSWQELHERIHNTITRRLKKGGVLNGVNGKI